MKRAILTTIIDDMYTVAETVAKYTPSFGHVVSDASYHPKLATKQLLDSIAKDRIAEESGVLCTMMTHCSGVHWTWGMTPGLQEDSEWAERIAFARSAFNAAKTALVVIAGITIVERLSGDQAKREAAKLLETKRVCFRHPW